MNFFPGRIDADPGKTKITYWITRPIDGSVRLIQDGYFFYLYQITPADP